ncbi:hypothetical protein POSPLADRAFT_1141193 [Postia placenta MAD-698-R-SB12]|uniref:Uncharacterized protein n=1 Tax=Postia placenta MAD-698-R-SB12 TaxID=670580 RepID=A0A1X6N363_9APHY|nr:hypothetical protein POSPLADRAFT_1141193 [Postia placenta MAD-698-R-SB12]OSX62970.1 hypothetical protein POSPLADRAFT_1141193 [Postia placenta MAD-698-R-SB12]
MPVHQQSNHLNPNNEPALAVIDNGLQTLLCSFLLPTGNEQEHHIHSTPTRPALPPPLFDWGLSAALGHTELPPSTTDQHLSHLSRALLDHLDTLSGSDPEDDEQSEDNEPPINGDYNSAIPYGAEPSGTSGKGPALNCTWPHEPMSMSQQWFPWTDKVTCTLDILMHLPRSVFSHWQLDLFLWLLKVNDINDVPSVHSMHSMNAALQHMCGIDSTQYKGALGHNYTVNNLSQIIAQEMANPKACQAKHWLEEMPDEQLSPMARIRGKDYFIHELSMLISSEHTGKPLLHAKCWCMHTATTNTQMGWCVKQEDNFIVSETQFLKNFTEVCTDTQSLYGIPDPQIILGMIDFVTEYNIHFLAMSNTTPPLEMLDGIVEQLEPHYVSYIMFNLQPAHEKVLEQESKKIISSICDGVGIKKTALTDFTYTMAMKYRCGGAGDKLDKVYTVHVTILWWFLLKHPELLCTEVEDTTYKEEGVADKSSPRGSPAAKKHKVRTRCAGGRVAQGQCFWSQVNAFFARELSARGTNMANVSWKEYIDKMTCIIPNRTHPNTMSEGLWTVSAKTGAKMSVGVGFERASAKVYGSKRHGKKIKYKVKQGTIAPQRGMSASR